MVERSQQEDKEGGKVKRPKRKRKEGRLKVPKCEIFDR
jgi:hypothetical protein